MYEDLTYDMLLQRCLARVPDNIDKREGSIIFNAIAISCIENINMYMELDNILNTTYADTAPREYLKRRASERGIEADEATNAILKGVFNIAVDIGARFSCDSLNYEVTDIIDDVSHSYKLKCETSGTVGNSVLGTLIPINYIQGLKSAELTEVLIPGEDEQGTEDLRQEYFESYDSQAYGGNRADYKRMFKDDVRGIGGIKIYRAWNGGGTVKIVCIDSAFNKPTDELISTAQEQVDPIGYQGEGIGLAPIDHRVTLFAVSETKVNITTNITYQNGWNYEECKPNIESVIDTYYKELNKTWADSDNLVIRISQIETRLLGVEGILDIADTTLNGSNSNLIIGADYIPVRGDFSG